MAAEPNAHPTLKIRCKFGKIRCKFMKIRCKSVVNSVSEKKKKRQNLQRILEKKTPKRPFGYSSDTHANRRFRRAEETNETQKVLFFLRNMAISRCKTHFSVVSFFQKKAPFFTTENQV